MTNLVLKTLLKMVMEERETGGKERVEKKGRL